MIHSKLSYISKQIKTSTSSLGSLIMKVWYASELFSSIQPRLMSDDQLALMTFIKMFPAFMGMATPFAVSN